MKTFKIFLGLLLVNIFSLFSLSAQKFSYVDTEYILGKIPEYNSAQKSLETLAEGWKKEVDSKLKEIEKLWKEYQAQQVLLPEEMRKKKEEEIVKMEDELNKYKEEKFGKEGELFKKRKELIKPIQDKVFDAIQTLAKEEGLDFIFDKSGAVTMLYVNAKFDRSDEVLGLLGIKTTE
jgi:outer membrane protein